VHIFLISGRPEIHTFFRLKNHYPAGISREADPGLTFTEIDLPAGDDPPDLRGLDEIAVGSGPVVAHLTGTSASMLAVAGALRSRSVPYVYSPSLPSVPSRPASLAAGMTGVKTAAVEDAALAGKIAEGSFSVIAGGGPEESFLRRRTGIPAGRLITLRGPSVQGPPPSTAAPAHGGAVPGTTPFGNLAVAFCDQVAPEWNVMRFLFAMEKINADAVIVAGRNDTPGSRESLDRAKLNARVKFLWFEPGNPGKVSVEVSRLIGRASIVVDPSLRGLGGAIMSATAAAGLPSVVSRSSVHASGPDSGLFSFEPTSWELLNHALTSAFNRSVSGGPAAGTAPGAASDAEVARVLTQVYSRAAGG
jgi:hypothetical protein